MRKRSSVLLIAAALSMLAMAEQAQAALTVSGPISVPALNAPAPADNRPLFYQDANGLALSNCLDNTPLGGLTPMCTLGLLEEQDYSPTKPIVYNGGLGLTATGIIIDGATGFQDNPGKLGGIVNYPGASFYYHVSPNPKGAFPIGTGTIRLMIATVESAGVSKNLVQVDTLPPGVTPRINPASIGVPRPVDGQQANFQRYAVDITNAQAGAYVFTHPWGIINFNCPVTGVLCKFVQDTPLGSPMNFLGVPDPVLGGATANTIGPFMVAADPTIIPAVPAPLFGNAAGHSFIGSGNGVLTKGIVPGVCANCPKDANGFSFFQLDAPLLGISTGPIPNFQISGQVFGMGVSPSLHDFGANPITTPIASNSPVSTFTITNVNSAGSMTIPVGALTLTGPNLADFVIDPLPLPGAPAPAFPPCATIGTLPPAGGAAPSSCTVSVAFAPKPMAPAAEVAVRTAKLSITGATFPPVAPAVTPTTVPAGVILLSGTAQYSMAVTADVNGTINPLGAAVLVDAGAAKAFTIQPNAKFEVKDITVNGALAHFVPTVKPGDPVTFAAPAATANGTTVNVTFMPSGDLDGNGTLDSGDALKALKILVGLQAPVGDDLVAMKVFPLDATGRPNPAAGAPADLNDVVLVLKRALGIIVW